MTTASTTTSLERFTVAGLLRHLAAAQPDHEMLVVGDVRRTWAEEYAPVLPGGPGLPARRRRAR